jgi:hypothetical protein
MIGQTDKAHLQGFKVGYSQSEAVAFSYRLP